MCDKYVGKETIEHIFLDCEVNTEIIWEKLRDLLQQCKSYPGVVNLSQKHINLLEGHLSSKQRGERRHGRDYSGTLATDIQVPVG